MLANSRAVKKLIVDASGSMTVEFVVLVPLLLAALVFSFEFARALWAYDVMTRDVRAGVRYLSRASTSCGSAAETNAENIAKTGLINGTDADAHFPWKGVSPTFDCTSVAFSSANFNQDGSVITMTAHVPVALSFMSFLNTVTGLTGLSGQQPLNTSYTLAVADQARFLGN